MNPADNLKGAPPEIVVYGAERLKQLTELIAAARARLAGIDAAFTLDKTKVDFIQSRLFAALRPLYEQRDAAKQMLGLKRRLLEAKRRKDSSAAGAAREEYNRQAADSKRQYEEAAEQLQPKTPLTPNEEVEIQQLWKKLVRLYHPDRFAFEPEKQDAYTKLTAAINGAKDAGDIATLREIASDPQAFIHKRGWRSLDFSDGTDVTQLEKLYRGLLAEIEKTLGALKVLRETLEFQLAQAAGTDERAFERTVEKQRSVIEAQLKEINSEIAVAEKALVTMGGADET